MDEFRFKDLRPDVPLLDYIQVENVPADGIATIEVHGPNVALTYFRWGCEAGSSLVRRIPVITVTRPATSFLAGRGGLMAVLPYADRSLVAH